MSRYKIESRDKELVGKFRAKVEEKTRKKKARIKILILLVFIGCAGLFFVSNQINYLLISSDKNYRSDSVKIKRDAEAPEPPVPPVSTVPPVAAKKGVAESTPEVSPGKMAVLDKKEVKSNASEVEDQQVKSASHQIEPEGNVLPVQERSEEITGKDAHEYPSLVSAKDERQADPFEPPVEPMVDSKNPGGRIAEIVTCQEIASRQYVLPQQTFSLSEGLKPYVWMDVRSEDLPYTLSHVYYIEGKRYCSVPLSIDYPRMRTWSNITLKHKSHVGNWRVDVVKDTGDVISSITFNVIP